MLRLCQVQGQRYLSSVKKELFYERIADEIKEIKESGLFKVEQVLASPQAANVSVKKKIMINFCANNYLGLSNHPAILEAGETALKNRGAGMSSVRFICGTQDLHKRLESKLSHFHGTQDTILYTSCFDANAGLFETILGPEDAVISDALNHASIIDGIRLCKAQRYRFKHGDMEDLERILKEAVLKSRNILIATDGVFSMDGDFANLPKICKLAKTHGALVYVDDSHATGFVGKRGRGTAEHFGLESSVDITCSTLGKALGGSSGGYTTGRSEIITLLRQRSRPYLFSNSLPPVIAAFALKAIEMVDEDPLLIEKVHENTSYYRSLMKEKGYKFMGNGEHPICPVLIGDAKVASKMAEDLRNEGILVTAFSYPVVPHGTARIRVQISAAHSKRQIEQAAEAFAEIGKKYKVIQ